MIPRSSRLMIPLVVILIAGVRCVIVEAARHVKLAHEP